MDPTKLLYLLEEREVVCSACALDLAAGPTDAREATPEDTKEGEPSCAYCGAKEEP